MRHNFMYFWAIIFFETYFSFSMTIPEQDLDPEDPKICGSYRELARLPNPLSQRGHKCCKNETCYFNTKDSPWSHVSELPECSEKILPQFLFFSPELQNDSFRLIDPSNLSSHNVSNLHTNNSRQFYTIIHGWNTKWKSSWVMPMKDELINLGYNVLVVNWTNGSNIKDYIQSAANTRTVGETVAEVLHFLNDSGIIKLSQTTIIGFSLGAHTAGYAGRNLPGLWRIIGLDPAGPLFVCEHPLARLDKTDANFVITVHTNGQSVFEGGLGTLETMGHIDFYPNGGITQSGCPIATKSLASKIIRFDFSHIAGDLSCSHTRAALLWTEIIKQSSAQYSEENYKNYKAFQCQDSKSWKYGKCFDCGQLGCVVPNLFLDANNTKQRGKYFFNTLPDNAEAGVYCGHQYKLTLTSNDNAKGQVMVTLKNHEFASDPLEFQKKYHIIKAGEPRSEILVTQWPLWNVTEISLTYNRYTNILWKDGIKTFQLVNCTLQNSNGEIFASIEKNIELTSGETKSVQLMLI